MISIELLAGGKPVENMKSDMVIDIYIDHQRTLTTATRSLRHTSPSDDFVVDLLLRPAVEHAYDHEDVW